MAFDLSPCPRQPAAPDLITAVEAYPAGGIQRVFDAPKPVTFGAGVAWDLCDPAHDPAEFLVLLQDFYWPILDEPLRSTLPDVFNGIDLPPGSASDRLYD